MAYKVRFADDSLMDGRDWVLCSQHADGTVLYVRRGARKLPDADMEKILENAWLGYRKMAATIPEQRASVSA